MCHHLLSRMHRERMSDWKVDREPAEHALAGCVWMNAYSSCQTTHKTHKKYINTRTRSRQGKESVRFMRLGIFMATSLRTNDSVAIKSRIEISNKSMKSVRLFDCKFHLLVAAVVNFLQHENELLSAIYPCPFFHRWRYFAVRWSVWMLKSKAWQRWRKLTPIENLC